MGGLNWSDKEYQDYMRRTGKEPREKQKLQTFRDILHSTLDMQTQIDSILGEKEDEDETVLTRPDAPELKFDSKTEQRAWEEWVPTTGCIGAYTQVMSVYLTGGHRYKWDFTLRMPDRELWLIEVKGTWSSKGGRASKLKLKQAAAELWWLGRWFALLPKKGGGWNLEEFK